MPRFCCKAVGAAIFGLSVLLSLAAVATADEPSEAFAFYLDYLQTAAHAETIADIAPFMPPWWRARYESADEATQAGALERIRDLGRDLKQVTLEQEQAVEDAVRLTLTALEQNDFPMRGEVLLVREAGSFIVEESRWATSP